MSTRGVENCYREKRRCLWLATSVFCLTYSQTNTIHNPLENSYVNWKETDWYGEKIIPVLHNYIFHLVFFYKWSSDHRFTWFDICSSMYYSFHALFRPVFCFIFAHIHFLHNRIFFLNFLSLTPGDCQIIGKSTNCSVKLIVDSFFFSWSSLHSLVETDVNMSHFKPIIGRYP